MILKCIQKNNMQEFKKKKARKKVIDKGLPYLILKYTIKSVHLKQYDVEADLEESVGQNGVQKWPTIQGSFTSDKDGTSSKWGKYRPFNKWVK